MTKAKYKDEESLRKAKEKLPDLEFRRMKNGEVVVAKKRKAETGKIKTDKTNQIIIYNTENGETKIEVRMKDETVWLSQKQMAELFDCTVDNISLHLRNIF